MYVYNVDQKFKVDKKEEKAYRIYKSLKIYVLLFA